MTPITSDPHRGLVLPKEDRIVTMKNSTPSEGRNRAESGFALIIAILALLLLTFLGLTLATSTSTELQIATNYRWGQQALYNAEAGLEAAKIILSNPPIATNTGISALPLQRNAPASWLLNVGVPPLEPPAATRDFENGAPTCDRRGGGMGYGRVLTDGATFFENVSTWPAGLGGQTLNGTFTIWVRRDLVVDDAGQFADSADNFTAVVTVEGSAPYIDNTSAFTQANRAVRILETTLTLNQGQQTSCAGLEGQVGQAPQGDNFGCAMLDDGSVAALQQP